MAHSYEIRKAVMAAIDAGMLGKDVEKIFGVSISSQQLWKRRLNETGDFACKPPGLGHPPHIKTNDFIEYMSCPVNQVKHKQRLGRNLASWRWRSATWCEKLDLPVKKRLHLPRIGCSEAGHLQTRGRLDFSGKACLHWWNGHGSETIRLWLGAQGSSRQRQKKRHPHSADQSLGRVN